MRKKAHFRHESTAAEADPEAFAERAIAFSSVLVDASSLIVLADIGAFQAASRAWHLFTIPQAASETGPAAEDVDRIAIEDEGLSTDRALVKAAAKERLPLLSEDRKVLRAAEELNIDCFDVLVALELLFAGGALTPDEYADANARLTERNSYRGDQLAWAQAVGSAAAKLA